MCDTIGSLNENKRAQEQCVIKLIREFWCVLAAIAAFVMPSAKVVLGRVAETDETVR